MTTQYTSDLDTPHQYLYQITRLKWHRSCRDDETIKLNNNLQQWIKYAVPCPVLQTLCNDWKYAGKHAKHTH